MSEENTNSVATGNTSNNISISISANLVNAKENTPMLLSASNLEDNENDQITPKNRKESFNNFIKKWIPNDIIYWASVYVTIPLLLWSSIFFILGEPAWPGGQIFAIFFLLFTGIGLGMVLQMIKVPPLLALLIMGIAAKNVPYIDFGKDLSPNVSAPIRQLALVVILIRAGLGLDPIALMKLKGVVIRLAFCPCLFEATTVAIATHFILDFPWAWGFLLGFVLAAVSPAVVVPCLLSLGDRGYGVEKGIPTIVIAAASVDDILAISLFGVTLGTVFSQENILQTLSKGPLELFMGIAYGICYGVFIGMFISRTEESEKTIVLQRAFFCFFGGCLAVFGFQYAEYPGAGALGCLAATFVAAVIWRRKGVLKDDDPLCYIFSILWYFFQPLLFGLIGCEINLGSLDGKTVGLGVVCLVLGLTVRAFVAFLSVGKSGLNTKEKIFVAVSWFPKATVQAAIGSIALDTARQLNFGEKELSLGLQVLTLAVVAILITAPIGSMGVMLLGPKLLEKQKSSIEKEQELTDMRSQEVS